MGDSTISQLPPIPSLLPTDVIPVDHGGVTMRATIQQINDAIDVSVPDLQGGAAGSIPYQSAPSTTTFLAAGTSGQILESAGAGGPAWVNQASLAAGSAANITGGVAGAVLYQSGTSTTAFSAIGTSSQVLISNGVSAPSWMNQSAILAGMAIALASGAAYQIPYQSGTGTTAFTTAGTTGQVLSANSAGAPSWLSQSTLVVGGIVGGAPGEVAYQSGTSTSAFTTAGTSSQVFISNGTGAPSWLSQSAMLVGLAAAISGGVPGGVLYQAGTNTTAFTTAGTAGQVLSANGTGAPSWMTPGAASSLSGGAPGDIPYQSGTNTTAFTTAGTSGQLFQSNGTSAPSWMTPLFAVTTATNTFSAANAFANVSGNAVDLGTSTAGTSTFAWNAGEVQTWTNGGAHTIATASWPTTGQIGWILLIGTNLGAYTITWPNWNWIEPGGTTTTSIATYLAANGTRTALQTSGVDQIAIWSRDAGTTIYAKLV